MFAKVSVNAFDLSNAFQKRDQDRSRNVTIKILFRNCFGTCGLQIVVWGQGIPSTRYSNLIMKFLLKRLLLSKVWNYNSIVDDCHIYIILSWIHNHETLHKRLEVHNDFNKNCNEIFYCDRHPFFSRISGSILYFFI